MDYPLVDSCQKSKKDICGKFINRSVHTMKEDATGLGTWSSLNGEWRPLLYPRNEIALKMVTRRIHIFSRTRKEKRDRINFCFCRL